MAKFKVGDRVRTPVYAHTGYDGEGIITEDGTHDDVWIVNFDNGMSGGLSANDLVLVAATPIRTITRREIVPGVYGDVEVFGADKLAYLDIVSDSHTGKTADQLRSAARIFNEIADVLEENA